MYALSPPARTTPEAGLRRHSIWRGELSRTTRRRGHRARHGTASPATGTEQPLDWAHYEGELTLKHSASRRRRSRTGRLHKQLQTRSGALPGVIVSSRRAIGRRRVRASRPPRPRLVRPVRRARSRFRSHAQRRSRPAVEATVNRERQRRCPSFATTRSGDLSAVIVSSGVPPGDEIGPRRL